MLKDQADELHLWYGQKGRLLWESLRTGSATRANRQFITITTAGFDKQGLCYEQYQLAKENLANPKLNPSYLPLIYEYEGDDYFNESNWFKANPALGHHVDIDSYRERAIEAKRLPTALASFRQLYLNAWIEHAEKPWIPLELWDACEDDFNPDDLIGMPCHMAIDCASVKDLFSLSAIFHVEGKWRILHWSWIGEESAKERTRRDGVQYDHWIGKGKLRTTTGIATNFDQVAQDVIELAQRFDVQRLVLDPMQGRQLATQLSDAGINTDIYTQNVQGFSYPAKQLERWLLEGKLSHQGKQDPVMRWAIGNTVVEIDKHENYFPSKKKSHKGGRRIDPVVSLIMACGAALSEEGSAGEIFVFDSNMQSNANATT